MPPNEEKSNMDAQIDHFEKSRYAVERRIHRWSRWGNAKGQLFIVVGHQYEWKDTLFKTLSVTLLNVDTESIQEVSFERFIADVKNRTYYRVELPIAL